MKSPNPPTAGDRDRSLPKAGGSKSSGGPKGSRVGSLGETLTDLMDQHEEIYILPKGSLSHYGSMGRTYIYLHENHTNQWRNSTSKRWRFVRGHDEPRLMGVASHLLSRWYILLSKPFGINSKCTGMSCWYLGSMD